MGSKITNCMIISCKYKSCKHQKFNMTQWRRSIEECWNKYNSNCLLRAKSLGNSISCFNMSMLGPLSPYDHLNIYWLWVKNIASFIEIICWVLTLYCTLTPAPVGHRIGDIESSEKPRTINVLGLSLNPKT